MFISSIQRKRKETRKNNSKILYAVDDDLVVMTIKSRPGNTCIGIHDIKPAGKKFLDAIRKYICTENAFPPVSQFDCVYIDICKRLLTIPQEKEITITDTLRDKVNNALVFLIVLFMLHPVLPCYDDLSFQFIQRF